MKKKEEKQTNEYIEFIKKLWKNKRGKALVFFIFYIVFFAIIIASANGNSQEVNNTSKNNIRANYNIEMIEKGNYHFIREENINGNIITYVGDKSNDKTKGLMTTNNIIKEYFIYGDITLIKENNTYHASSSLYNFNNITKDDMIKKILNKSILLSKTEYELGNTIYNYQISTTTLEEMISNQKIDIDDKPNDIIVETNDKNEIVKIAYDLSSYSTYKNNKPQDIKITISYSRYNEIEEITIPEIK